MMIWCSRNIIINMKLCLEQVEFKSVSFDQPNASSLNKSINFFQIKTLLTPKLLNDSVYKVS